MNHNQYIDLLLERTDVTQTPTFKKWFIGSKVINKQGNPLVVYHASKAKFDAFHTNSTEMGAHFGTKKQAGSFKRPEMNAYYLSIKNPYRLSDMGMFDPLTVAYQLVDKKVINQKFADKLEDAMGQYGEREAILRLQHELEKHGYDGIVYMNRRENVKTKKYHQDSDFEKTATDNIFKMEYPSAEDSFIAFHPEQIKSVAAKEFNPKSPDVNEET